MDLTDTICSLVDKPTSHADVDTVDDTAAAPADEATEPSAPRGLTSGTREGMSPGTAKFLIGRCGDQKDYEIYGIQNRGRYFIAKILNAKGKVVNEVLVDKLNGKVRFLRDNA